MLSVNASLSVATSETIAYGKSYLHQQTTVLKASVTFIQPIIICHIIHSCFIFVAVSILFKSILRCLLLELILRYVWQKEYGDVDR